MPQMLDGVVCRKKYPPHARADEGVVTRKGGVPEATQRTHLGIQAQSGLFDGRAMAPSQAIQLERCDGAIVKERP